MELYPFTNLNNFNWPKLVTGENSVTITGDVDVTIFARGFEALGV